MLDKMALSNFSDIKDDFAILVISSGGDLEETNSDIIKEIMKKNELCLYVTVNQPYDRIVHVFEKKKINVNKMFFIDCITETSGGRAERTGNCLYLNSPSNLTELGISISHALQAMPGKKFLFMDALSTLIIYNTPNSFSKFAHFLMTRVKLLGLNGIFMVVEREIGENVFSEIKQFSDKIIKLN